MGKYLFGCVADDFTGASDVASFLADAGLKTVLVNGIPSKDWEAEEGIQAIVIALKTRTMPVEEATEISLNAFIWLKNAGTQKLYFKYCSTFDSTKDGNIGPVIDAVLKRFSFPYTVLCPSLPVNGRTVKDGRLFVYGVPLHESHMKAHPLTPMWDSRIEELMKDQGKHPCITIGVDALSNEKECAQLKEQLNGIVQNGKNVYLVPDYYEEVHGQIIAEKFWDLDFHTGGSGLAGAIGTLLAKNMIKNQEDHTTDKEQTESKNVENGKNKAILLAGSCSSITLKQIDTYQKAGHPSYRIKPLALVSGEEGEESIWRWVKEQKGVPLIYSSAPNQEIIDNQKSGKEMVSFTLERTMAQIAVRAAEEGYTGIIVAGGETSGAVTQALGCSSYYIGESVAPGVPVMVPMERPSLRLVLKSGNFGQEDFFEKAIELTEKV